MKVSRSQGVTGIVLFVVVLLTTLPLWQHGIPRGHDWMFELVRIAQMQASLEDGQLPAAWAPDLYHGWGSPIFLFYAPLFALTASAGVGLLGSTEPGVLATLVLLLTLGAGGIILASQQLSLAEGESEASHRAASSRVALYLFLFNPYLLADLYLRNAFAELTALCLAPYLLAAIFAAGRRPRWALFGTLAGSVAILLAHNLSALIYASLVLAALPLLYGFFGSRGGKARKAVLIGGGWGFALTLWFWWPAVALKPLIRSEELLTGKFRFQENFATLGETFGWGRIVSVGPLIALVLFAGIILLIRTPRDHPAWRIRCGLVSASLVYLFFMRALSIPLWEVIPWMPLLQFPWRFLGPFALVTSLLGGVCFSASARNSTRRRRRWIEVTIALLVIFNALPTLLAVRPLPADVRRDLDRILAPELVREYGQTATVGDEYVPRRANSELWKMSANSPITLGSGRAIISVDSSEGSQIAATVLATEPSLLDISSWYFPGWMALVDGESVEISRGAGGNLNVPVNPGRHQLVLYYYSPAERRLGLLISSFALLIGLLWGVLALFQNHFHRR